MASFNIDLEILSPILFFIVFLVMITYLFLFRKTRSEPDTYTIYYRRFLFWQKISNVVEDGFITDRFTNYGLQYGMRFFAKSDKSVLEIPASYQFRFPPERHHIVEANRKKAEEAEREAARKVEETRIKN